MHLMMGIQSRHTDKLMMGSRALPNDEYVTRVRARGQHALKMVHVIHPTFARKRTSRTSGCSDGEAEQL